MKALARLLLAFAMLASGAAPGAEPLKAFDAKSLDGIRAGARGKPFVLAFWSVTCEPCRDEMRIFKAAQRKFPGIRIHLVSADPPGGNAAITAFLRRYDPGPVARWAFADEFSERVRYSVDPEWRGELPRTYLFDAQHVPKAVTGTLERKSFEAWLATPR